VPIGEEQLPTDTSKPQDDVAKLQARTYRAQASHEQSNGDKQDRFQCHLRISVHFISGQKIAGLARSLLNHIFVNIPEQSVLKVGCGR
jgi:hypothetical protein